LYDYLQLINFQGLPVKIIQSIALQTLSGLLFLHKNHIIHCDLKPENIVLINPKKSAVKIIDFGSCCIENSPLYTYIQSRFYRAPEVLLGVGYNEKIDIWSLGCILLELFLGYPLFTGRNEEDQLTSIVKILGPPPLSLLKNSTKNKDLPDHSKIISNPLEKIQEKDPSFHDFLQSTFYLESLSWSPDSRMTTEDALKHEWSHMKYE
jgi:dual specificity tyrosine-phosphorylation-regulated kinase 2/3/4